MKQNWQIKKLKDICEKGSSNVNMKDLTDLQGEYPIYGASGLIKNVNFYHQEKEYIGIIKDGSGIGRTMLLPPKSSVIGTLQYILPKEGNLIQFINYALQSLDLTKFKQGAAIPHIYFKDYGETEIVVPPLADQRRIVDILDAKFAQIDALKAAAQKNLDNAEQLWKAQLEKEFGNKEWKMMKLGEVCEKIGDGIHGTPTFDNNGDCYFINGSNLSTFDIIITPETKKVNQDEYLKYKLDLSEKTVFLSINGNTLAKRTAFYKNEPVILGKSACYMNTKHCINKYYLRHFLNSDTFYKYAWNNKTGAAIPNLGLKALRDCPIPISSLAEQTAIVSRLDALSAQISELKTKYRRQIECCDELRQSLLRAAFEGEM